MTREDIEQLNVLVPYCFETDLEEKWYNIGLKHGLEIADEEPNLESLWHDVSEEPELNQWFLAQIGDDAFDTFVMAMEKNQDWKNWSNGINIKIWAYIDDLLPKGGKK